MVFLYKYRRKGAIWRTHTSFCQKKRIFPHFLTSNCTRKGSENSFGKREGVFFSLILNLAFSAIEFFFAKNPRKKMKIVSENVNFTIFQHLHIKANFFKIKFCKNCRKYIISKVILRKQMEKLKDKI